MQHNNSGFYAAAAILLTAASFLYSWKYLVPSYQKNLETLAKTNKEIELSKVKLESLQNTKNSLDQLGTIVDQLFISVPADKDAPDLITELEAIGVKNKIVIPSIQIADATAATPATAGTAAPAPTSNAIAVSFSINGSFEDLNHMITDLEKDIRFTNIKSLTFSSSSDNKTMSLSVQLEVYRRSSSLLLGAGSAASAGTSATTGSNAGTGVQ